MSDQFNLSSVPSFSISRISPEDLPTVLDCMNEIYRELPKKSWFSMDEREDLIRYMTVSGFGLKAEAVAADDRKELAAVFVARTSDLGDENLRSYLGTAHPDNVYSVHNFEQLGYKLVTKALKYGGLPRYIFCKKI